MLLVAFCILHTKPELYCGSHLNCKSPQNVFKNSMLTPNLNQIKCAVTRQPALAQWQENLLTVLHIWRAIQTNKLTSICAHTRSLKSGTRGCFSFSLFNCFSRLSETVSPVPALSSSNNTVRGVDSEAGLSLLQLSVLSQNVSYPFCSRDKASSNWPSVVRKHSLLGFP